MSSLGRYEFYDNPKSRLKLYLPRNSAKIMDFLSMIAKSSKTEADDLNAWRLIMKGQQ